jgi:Ala-tRNA(Pro) deacylase
MGLSEEAGGNEPPAPADTYSRMLSVLDAAGARYRLIDHPAEGRTDVVSALRKHNVGQAAKSIIIRVSASKRDRRYLLAVVPGNKRVDLVKLKRAVGGGGSRAGFAAREVAESLAGSVSGSIPPISFHPDLELVVDHGLLAHDELFFNAARLDRSIALATADYLRIVRPRIDDIALDESDAA